MQRSTYLSVTARTCSISYKRILPEEELRAILTGKKPLTREWMCHFYTLFAEVPHGYLAGTMRELGVSLNQVESVYEALPPVLQGKHFREFVRHERNMEATIQSSN